MSKTTVGRIPPLDVRVAVAALAVAALAVAPAVVALTETIHPATITVSADPSPDPAPDPGGSGGYSPYAPQYNYDWSDTAWMGSDAGGGGGG